MIAVQREQDLQDVDAASWNGLLQRNVINEAFLTHEWIECWWAAFGSGHELLLLTAYEGDRLAGIAPLMRRVSGNGLQRRVTIEFLGTGVSDYLDFIAAPADKPAVLGAFVDYLGARAGPWDVLSLQNVPSHSDTAPLLAGYLEEQRWKVRSRVSFPCPTLVIRDDPEFALQCTRKKSLKRHFNYFKRTGELTFEHARTPDEVEACLGDFFLQHTERRALVGDSSGFGRVKLRDFYTRLVRKLLPGGWLRFAIIRLDGEALAYHFGFDHANKFTWYKPTFNVDYLAKSPGEVLIKLLLEDAIERDLDEFDFTIGDEGFKRRFANLIRENLEIVAYRSRFAWLNDSARAAVRGFLKRNFARPIAAARDFIGSLRRPDDGTLLRDCLVGAYGIARGVRRRLFSVDRGTVFRSAVPAPDLPPEEPPLAICEGNISAARELGHELSNTSRIHLISAWRDRLRCGHRLFRGKVDGRSTLLAWVDAGDELAVPGSDKPIEIEGEAALVYDFHIMEDTHGQDARAMALYCLAGRLREDGTSTILADDPGRTANKNTMKSAGFTPFLHYTRIHLFGVRAGWQRYVTDD